MNKANLIEIYASMQGEGPYVGTPMTFVRFQDCALSCKFCDTPASFKKFSHFRMEAAPFSERFCSLPNPVSASALTSNIDSLGQATLSLTGGEPLQQDAFLHEWLEYLHGRYRVFLETNGVLPQALKRIIALVDIVSMDIKLPSVTGMRPYWEEHEKFLGIAKEKEVYVKMVISNPTEEKELEEALGLVERVAPGIPFILQPVTPAWQVKEPILEARLKKLYEISCEHLSDVRVIPQVHPIIGVL